MKDMIFGAENWCGSVKVETEQQYCFSRRDKHNNLCCLVTHLYLLFAKFVDNTFSNTANTICVNRQV